MYLDILRSPSPLEDRLALAEAFAWKWRRDDLDELRFVEDCLDYGRSHTTCSPLMSISCVWRTLLRVVC